MSIAGGVARALWRGQSIGCDVIQLFTKNAMQWRAKPLTQADRAAFVQAQEETGVIPVAVHDSYLINLATPDEGLYTRSQEALWEEVQRTSLLGIPYLVIHPGSPGGGGVQEGIDRIARGINRIHQLGAEKEVMVLMETTAGQGATLGNCFEHFARIIARIEEDARVGVCLDTCHIFAAGYDISTPQGYEACLDEFDRIIGLHRLKLIHVNDSRAAVGTRVDRHEHIGKGAIGLDAFCCILHDRRLASLPFILETPKGKTASGEDWDRVNLRTLRGLL
jgi:deoxyribonuclease-4